MSGRAAAPLDEEKGRVVTGTPAAFVLQSVGESAHRRPRSLRDLTHPVHAADEPFLTERRTALVAFLDDTVGVAQQPVTVPEIVSRVMV